MVPILTEQDFWDAFYGFDFLAPDASELTHLKPKRFRNRDPWLTLAHEQPTDGEETEDGNFYYHAKENF